MNTADASVARILRLLVASAVMVLGLVGPAAAEFRQVDGKLWTASTLAEKRAYMVGVANTLAVVQAVQAKRTGAADPRSAPGRLNAALDIGTLDNAIGKIDQWYQNNPSRQDAPVLGVIWLGLVKGQ